MRKHQFKLFDSLLLAWEENALVHNLSLQKMQFVVDKIESFKFR